MYIVFDLDGVILDDIEKKFNQYLKEPKKITTFLRGFGDDCRSMYKETVMLFPNLLPSKFSSQINSIDMHLEEDILKIMKNIQNNGYSLLVRTVNNGPIAKKLREIFEKEGINAGIEQIKTLDKSRPINGEPLILIEDNPFIALKAAKNNCPTILFLKSYNRFFGKIFSELNPNIYIVRNANEMQSKLDQLTKEMQSKLNPLTGSKRNLLKQIN